MNRRTFAKRSALGLTVLTLTTSAFKCGSEKVTIYVQTISAFLREIATLLPAQAQLITRIIAVATDFDAAYRRGDFTNATTFFNTLVSNLTTLTTSLGLNLSAQVKVALAIVSSTVRLIAVLLQQQGTTQPEAVARARAASPAASAAISTIERLANPAAVEATFQAAKL
jgi:hypothetical protein